MRLLDEPKQAALSYTMLENTHDDEEEKTTEKNIEDLDKQ